MLGAAEQLAKGAQEMAGDVRDAVRLLRRVSVWWKRAEPVACSSARA